MLKRLCQPHKLTSTALGRVQVPFQGRKKWSAQKWKVKRLPQAGTQVTQRLFLS